MFKEGYDFFKEYNKKEQLALSAGLKQKVFRLSETGVNPRIFNQWKREGLVSGIENDRKWISLDFGQYIWLKIIRDLRAFGVALEDIKFIKEKLTVDIYEAMKQAIPEEKLNQLQKELEEIIAHVETPVDYKPSARDLIKEMTRKHYSGPGNMIELSITGMLLSGKQAYLTLVLTTHINGLGFNSQREQRQQKEGTGKRKKALRQNLIDCFIDLDEFENMHVNREKIALLYTIPHLKIPLMQYIREFIADEKNAPKMEQIHLLRSDELTLLRELRKDNVTSVNVIMEPKGINGTPKINRMEIKEKMKKEEETRLIETFTSKEYAEITYQVADGKIVNFFKTLKIKPNQ